MYPLVVIGYNNHDYLDNTLVQAQRFGLRVLVVDNASDFEQTRAYLATIIGDTEVIQLPSNVGYTCWSRPEIYDRLPDRFFLSDPDLQWNPGLPADFPKQLDEIASAHGARKVGFALDLSDHNAMFSDADYHQGQSIHDWEKQFWSRRLNSSSHEIYDAPIDTTFQLFDKTKPHGPQIRVAGCFTAKHLPWYRESALSPHARLHMYVTSHMSTTAKLVLREMAGVGTLASAYEECRRSCVSPISAPAHCIEGRLS